jgi:hypothetical protein
VGLTTLPPSCTDFLEIWDIQPPGTLRACPGIALPDVLYFLGGEVSRSRRTAALSRIVQPCYEDEEKNYQFFFYLSK